MRNLWKWLVSLSYNKHTSKNFHKGNSKTILYMDIYGYKSFDHNKFNEELNSDVKKMKNCNISAFQDILLSVLNN